MCGGLTLATAKPYPAAQSSPLTGEEREYEEQKQKNLTGQDNDSLVSDGKMKRQTNKIWVIRDQDDQ